MSEEFVRKAISKNLAEQIDEMIEKIKFSFGLDISKIQASKIVCWKAKCYKVPLTEKRLIEILGGKV